jgi:hypothetical protein
MAQNWARVTGVDTARTIYGLGRHEGVRYGASDSLVYRSTDGLTWEQTATQPAPGHMIYGVFASHASGLYVGTFENGVFRTTNGGQTWTPAGTGLPSEDVLALAALGDSLFVGLGFSGVYVLNLTTPGAWMPYTTGLTQFGTNSLSVVGDRLYAGLGAGFFVRPRGAAQWTSIDLGASLQVYDVVGRGGAVYAATEKGVYKTPGPDSVWRAADIGGMKGYVIPSLAFHGDRLYAALNYRAEHWVWSTDNGGALWDVRAHEFAEVVQLRVDGDRLVAGRIDGLWFLDLQPVNVRPAGWVRERGRSRDVPSADRWRLDGRRVHTPRAAHPTVKRPNDIPLPSGP